MTTNQMTRQLLIQLKQNGATIVNLDGFNESIDYVLSLDCRNIKHTGQIKSGDGYSTIECFEII